MCGKDRHADGSRRLESLVVETLGAGRTFGHLNKGEMETDEK